MLSQLLTVLSTQHRLSQQPIGTFSRRGSVAPFPDGVESHFLPPSCHGCCDAGTTTITKTKLQKQSATIYSPAGQ